MNGTLLPLLGIFLAIASVLLSMIETAFSKLTETMRQTVRQRSKIVADQLEKLMLSRREVLSAIQLADNLVTLPLIFICLWWLDIYLPGWLAAILLFTVVILFCELLPKLIGFAQPVKILSLCWPLVTGLYQFLKPVVRLMLKWNDYWMARLSGGQSLLPTESLSLEEMYSLLEIAKEDGGLREEEATILRKITKLSFETANHCMVPRVDTFTLSDDLTNSAAASLLRKGRHRRVPIRGETPDDILGVLDTQEFLLSPQDKHYTEILKSPSFVPKTIPLLDLFISFETHQQNIAILLDEYGGTEGIVTLVDVLEEILGEEGPDSKAALSIEKMENGKVLASGNAHLDDLAEVLGIETSAFSAHTVGGLLIEHFGQLPKPGSLMLLEDWEIRVRRISRKRVLEVLISPLSKDSTASNSPS